MTESLHGPGGVNPQADHYPATGLIIALGKNIGIGSSPDDIRHDPAHLSAEGRLTAIAAGALWLERHQNGIDSDIIFSSGFTTVGTDAQQRPVRSEAKAMADYMFGYFKDPQTGHSLIPEARVLLEDQSVDTQGNAQAVRRIIHSLQSSKLSDISRHDLTYEAGSYQTMTLLTVGYHIKRARFLFEKTGVRIDDSRASEEIVARLSPHHQELMRQREKQLTVRLEGLKEKIGLLVVKTAPGVLQKVTRRSRGR